MMEVFSQIRKKDEKIKKSKDDHGRYKVNNADYKTVLIHNIPYFFTCDETDKLRYFKNHSIVIKDDIIQEVRPAKELDPADFDLVYDAGKRGGTVVTPGFINAHAHPPMYLLRSSMDLDEGDNIDETLAKLPSWESKMTKEDLALSTVGDLTEQQKFGVTTTFSHYNSFEAVEEAAKLTTQNVINGISVASHVSPENSPALIEKLLREEKNSYSRLAMAVHYLYKASPEVLKKVKNLIDEHDLLFTCHMSESERVVEETLKNHKMREVDVLESYGLLNKNTIVSHAIHLRDEEITRIAKAEVGVVHLPTSNRIHKSGVFPYWKYNDAGGFRNIALGTDSVVSKSRLDILTEAYRARTTHLYLKTIKFGSLFKMMTINGAKILNMPKHGRILPGYKADLVFWKLKDRGFVPFDRENPFTLLGNLITHSGRVARDLMIAGKFVIISRKHRLVDESRLLDILQERHMEMRRKVEKEQ